MTLQSAIKRLELEYKKAKDLQKMGFVYNPMAFALYKVWKMADQGKDGDENG